MWPFGNNYPYTNFHDMNLDWIIKQVKENKERITSFASQLQQMGIDIEEFRDYIESIDDTIQHEVETQVPIAIQHEIQTGGFNNLLSESHKRRIVCIGDSYGDGWTPDGTFPSWMAKLKAKLGIANADWCAVSVGGTGFGKDASTPTQYIPNLLQTAYETISNPGTVTDVIFGLGYNDYLYADTPSRITDGIRTAISTCKQKFPTARIHVYAIGFCTNKATQYVLNKVYQLYNNGLYDYQFANLSDALSEVLLFSTDGIHPLEAGQENIARRVCNAFNNSSDNYAHVGNIQASQIVFEMLIGDTQDVSGWMYYSKSENNLYLANIEGFKNINLGNTTANITGATPTKIAKLKSSPYIGYYYPQHYIAFPAMMYYTVSGSSNFQQMPIALTLAQDQANNDSNVYLWIKTEGMSGSGFQNIQNMTMFGITNACIKLPFITKV